MSFKNLTGFSMETLTPVDATTLTLTIIQAIYGVPSFVLLIFFLIFLGCGKNYSSSFYRVVQFDLLTNICIYSNTWLSLRTEKFATGILIQKSLETLLPGSLTWLRYLTVWFMHMQFLSATALSFHRITSVLWHSTYERAWSRWYIVFGLLCCLYSTLCEAIIPGKTAYVEIVDGKLTRFYDPIRGNAAISLIAVFSSLYFVLLAGINGCTAYLVAAQFKAANISDRGVGRKLAKISLTYSLIYLAQSLWSVTTMINMKFLLFPSIFSINLTLLAFASDFMTLALPYILLVYDTNVKNDLCLRRKVKKVSSVVVSVGPLTKSINTI